RQPIDLSEQIDAILIMFWNAGIDIDPLLNEWGKDHHVEAVLHFKDLYFEGFNEQYHRTKLSNPFGDKALADKLATWLASDAVKTHFAARIEQIILEEPQRAGDALNDLNMLYDILRAGSSSSYT
ncbi:MAG: hypothetical protein J7527_09100, partial [Chitinophagaceae bacterium]|nr:hypothetical protein [Chitinophagaceae bacterium]